MTFQRIDFTQMNNQPLSSDNFLEIAHSFCKLLKAYDCSRLTWLIEGLKFIQDQKATILALDVPKEDETYLEWNNNESNWVLSTAQYRHTVLCSDKVCLCRLSNNARLIVKPERQERMMGY